MKKKSPGPSSPAATKQLLINAKWFPRSDGNNVQFPEIRIAGKWLQDLGFCIGGKVNIVQENNKLTILLDASLPKSANDADNKARNNRRPTIKASHQSTITLHPPGQTGTSAA